MNKASNKLLNKEALHLSEYAGGPSVSHPLGVNQEVVWRASSGYHEAHGSTVCLLAYVVLSRTPCGVWIETYDGKKKRWVNLHSHKQFASVDKDTAIKQLHSRKGREVRILSSRLQNAQEDLALLDAYYATNP